MQKEVQIKLWATVLGGWFGLHKFIDGKIGMGVLYLFTIGLFCIGWLIDSILIIKEYFDLKNTKPEEPLMPQKSLDLIEQGKLARIELDSGSPLTLSSGEKLYYIERGKTKKSRAYTTGYKRSSVGASFRITKGISTHVGSGDIKAVRQTSTTTYNGLLFLTNKRIVYVSQNSPFDISLSKVTSVSLSGDKEVLLQSGNKVYSIDLITATTFIKAYHIVASRMKK